MVCKPEEQGANEKGCEVYVTRIPRELQDKDLVAVFSRIGELTDFRLMMEHNGLNRGYAYIRYQSQQEAKQAIKQLNNYEIAPNRYLVVTKSVDNRRLWVNGIPKSKSMEDIRKEMERLTVGVTDIILYPSQADKSKSRGYMFVEYESHKAAAMARRRLSQGSVSVCGQELGQVDWAEPEHEVDEETMSNVKILFVRNLMLSTTEDILRVIFNRKGNNEVERVKKTKDFAFIHFSSRRAAERALLASSQLKIDGALVEVLWSKPVDKKLYNTRKTLTKAFTLGTEILDGESGTFQPLEPRKRGAAGIRGLGAPGTTPSKQLIQRYCSLTASSVTTQQSKNISLQHMAFYRTAPELLADICLSNNWGEPQYALTIAPASTFGQIKMYIYKITIPNFPIPPPNNTFQPYALKTSAEEARAEAAHFVLACLRISPEYFINIGATYPLQPAQVYPVNPATYHGVPLTISSSSTSSYSPCPHPPVNSHSVSPSPIQTQALRLMYPDPYSGNYASLMTSMCAMNVNG